MVIKTHSRLAKFISTYKYI